MIPPMPEQVPVGIPLDLLRRLSADPGRYR
jgi:hypothetical protein